MTSCRIVFLVALSMLFTQLRAQEPRPDAEALLQQVQSKFERVKDYEADISIKVDVDFIKIPVKTGKAWFVQPDRVKVKTDGFSLLPKKGMNFSANQVLDQPHTALFSGADTLEGHAVWIIKVIPDDDSGDILLTKVWIDQQRLVIRRLESATRSQGTFEMKFSFPEVPGDFDLPESILFKFDLRKNEMPLGLTGDFNGQDSGKSGSTRNTRGTVLIRYRQYRINQGLGTAALRQKE